MSKDNPNDSNLLADARDQRWIDSSIFLHGRQRDSVGSAEMLLEERIIPEDATLYHVLYAQPATG